MYIVDAHGARDDIFGIGKGEAQIIDLSPTREAAAQEAERNFRAQQQEQKTRQAREEDVYTQLRGLNKVAIMDRDRPLFAQKQSELYDYVKKNINALRNGDANKLIEFQDNIGKIYTEAELSKNTREKAEQIGATLLSKGIDTYRPEDINRYYSFIKGGDQGEFVGNYDISQLTPKEKVNYGERVIKELSPFAQRMARETPYAKTFTKDQANDLIATDLADPVLFEQAAYDFNKAENKLGAKDPVEFYQKLYAPKLAIADTKAPPEYYVTGGTKEKEPKVSGTFIKEGDGKGRFQFEYTNPADNPYITIKDPNDPKKSLDIRPIAVNLNGRNTKMEVAIKLSESEQKANREAIEAGEAPPYKETADLNYTQTSDILHNKFKIKNVFDLEKGKVPEGVKVKYNDLSQPKSSVKSTTLSTIKAKVGTKGYEGYTEQELIDYYKSQGYEIK